MISHPLIHNDFLLQNEQARRLYHEVAADLPIIDYHCHLPPDQIARDRRFTNMTDVWLRGDHYKWRAMRTNGVDEHYCTGDADDWEKFEKWAETVPHLLRNPLYHWTHLELNRPFGINDRLLNPRTAPAIWEECNAQLAQPEYSCRGLMKYFNVRLVCTTDDPTDSLEHHQAIAGEPDFDIRVLPTWRPDKAMAVEDPHAFNQWVDKLAHVANVDIPDFDRFMEALHRRHEFFHSAGCRLSDHGLETIDADDYTMSEVKRIFQKVRRGQSLGSDEIAQFKSAMLDEFARMDHAGDWTQQYHIGALRNNNTPMFHKVGPDTGFDSIADGPVARPLSHFLNRMVSEGRLTRTILYNLNPAHNAVFATMIGNFQDGKTPGKMQWGSGWWFMDQKDGMERQMEDLSNMGLLSRFVGMLTDSRSFLSYTRHEYFRRILCNMLGQDMANGLIPDDVDLVAPMVRAVCYNNAAEYFGFDLPRID